MNTIVPRPENYWYHEPQHDKNKFVRGPESRDPADDVTALHSQLPLHLLDYIPAQKARGSEEKHQYKNDESDSILVSGGDVA